jgi:nucleotide-binding universal stress UspA family protein
MLNPSAHRGSLAGVDGSACSKVVVRWAVRVAVMRNEMLTLVHVSAMPINGREHRTGLAIRAR